jgi:hypothetical protein
MTDPLTAAYIAARAARTAYSAATAAALAAGIDPTAARLATDPACAITHLCDYLASRRYRLSDPQNYTESLPVPSADPVAVLNAVAATGESHLQIIDANGKPSGWVYLILPPAVSPSESVADYSDIPLLREWWELFSPATA